MIFTTNTKKRSIELLLKEWFLTMKARRKIQKHPRAEKEPLPSYTPTTTGKTQIITPLTLRLRAFLDHNNPPVCSV